MKRRIALLLVVVMCIAGFGELCNKISFDSTFSVIDALSGASKKKKKTEVQTETASEVENVDSWDYSMERLALPVESHDYKTVSLNDGDRIYYLLWSTQESNSQEIVMPAADENQDYLQSVQEASRLLMEQGYSVSIRNYTEIMFVSLAHAGKFDVVLIGEEENHEKLE